MQQENDDEIELTEKELNEQSTCTVSKLERI